MGDIRDKGAAADAVVHVLDVYRSFRTPNGTLTVLRGITLDVARGEMVAIVGASGVGKSTLLHLIGGLDPPTSGRIFWGDQSPYDLTDDRRALLRNRDVGFVFQFHHLLPEFTAQENVALPLIIRGDAKRDALRTAAQSLGDVGLADRLTHLPGEMSGGELQRAAVARALVTGAPLVIADEPSGNLDRVTAEQLHVLLGNLARDMNRAVIVATHNPELAGRADRVLAIRDGVLHETNSL